MYNDYYNHVDIRQFGVTSDDVKAESAGFEFKVVRFENTADVDNWFNEQVTWQVATVYNVSNSPNLRKIIQKLETVINTKFLDNDALLENAIGIRFYIQKAGSKLIEHQDYQETSVALNFTFDDNVAPLTFRDIGDVPYKCCLFNVRHFHSVKPSAIDRLILRITPVNTVYQDVCSQLDLAGMLIQS